MWSQQYGEYCPSPEYFSADPWCMPWPYTPHWQWANPWMDGGYHAASSSSSSGPVAPSAQKQQQTEESTRKRLLEIKEKVEQLSWTKLQSAHQIAVSNDFATELSICIERAIFFFDYEGTDSSPRGAVDALRQTTQALDMCGGKQPLFGELDQAAKKVRDTLSARTQLMVPMGDKKKYQSVLEAAYGGRIDDEENSRLMQSYRKTIWEQFEDAFPSNNKQENLKRGGPRPRRERAGQPIRNTANQEPEGPARVEIRPPPGLEIRNVDTGSEVSSTTRGPLHHNRQPIPLEGLHWPSYNIHYSGARTTQWSMRSETDAAVLDLDQTDPFEISTSTKTEHRILILTELDRVLVWLWNPTEWPGEGYLVMPNGKYLYTRPGVKDLVAFLLQQKTHFTFAVVSSLGHWKCLPAMRLLLEHAIEGTTWLVEETFAGDWYSYKEGLKYTIKKKPGEFMYEFYEPIDCATAEDGDYAIPAGTIEDLGNSYCILRRNDGHTQDGRGRLTEDGTLVWNFLLGEETISRVWTRAGRTAPPSLVCRDNDLRVYIFDRDSVTETIETTQHDTSSPEPFGNDTKEGTGEWFMLRKELHKVWSALAESGCGAFGARSTVVLDELKQTSSHPDNVIPIPLWRWGEEKGGEMVKLREYLRELASAPPQDVAEYLQSIPCPAFSTVG